MKTGTITHNVLTYTAEDGKIFLSESQCIEYETKIKSEEFFKSLFSVNADGNTWYKIDTEEDFNKMINHQKDENKKLGSSILYMKSFEKGWYAISRHGIYEPLYIISLETSMLSLVTQAEEINSRIEELRKLEGLLK